MDQGQDEKPVKAFDIDADRDVESDKARLDHSRRRDQHRQHRLKDYQSLILMALGGLALLMIGFAAIDLIPLITREGRVRKFQSIARPGADWAETRARLKDESFVMPTPPENLIQIVRMDIRTPFTLKALYKMTPSMFRKYLPGAYRDAWVSVNALGEIHNARVLRPGYSMSVAVAPTRITTGTIGVRRAAPASSAQSTTETKL